MISTTTFLLIWNAILTFVVAFLVSKNIDAQKSVKELNYRAGDLEQKTKNIILED